MQSNVLPIIYIVWDNPIQLKQHRKSNIMSKFTQHTTPIIGIEIETTLHGINGQTIGIRKIKNALANVGINYCQVEKDMTSSENTVFEIKLPPFANSNNINTSWLRTELDKIQTALQSINARITNKCGGHVHFGIEWLDDNIMTANQWNELQVAHVESGQSGFFAEHKTDIMPFELMKNVAYRYGLNQNIIDGFLPNSRTNNTYCKPIDRQVLSTTWKRATSISALNQVIGGKFYAVNFQNTDPNRDHNKRTIEFRQNSGSIEADKILKWVKLITKLFETTDDKFLDYSNNARTETTPEQPFTQGTRLGQIWELCRSDNGSSVQDLMMATGTTRSNIAGRISEMRSRFGDSAIVTSTQQANGRSYGSGDEFASYKILKTFNIGTDAVTALPANRAGNPSIWYGIEDDLFEYFNARAERFQS